MKKSFIHKYILLIHKKHTQLRKGEFSMAGFAFMDISKIKTEGQLTSKCVHNCRLIQIDNVIPELTENNETLVALPKSSGKTLNYNEAFKDRLSTLPYYQEHGIRSNAVLGYEVLLTFSKDESLDIESWKKQSTQWLHDTFDVAPDKRSNVIHAEFHADEVGNPHIHAFVVPIDERGRLNAKRFTDGSRAMSDMQSSYAKSVSNLGLKRGIAGSSAKHQDIRRMYANLNNAMNIPHARKNETAEEYRQRILDQAKTLMARGMREVDDYQVRRRQEMDEQLQAEREAMKLELKRNKKKNEHELKDLEIKKEELAKNIVGYESMMDSLLKQMEEEQQKLVEMESRFGSAEDLENKMLFYEQCEAGLEEMREVSPEEAEEIEEQIKHIQEIGEARLERINGADEENKEENEFDEFGEDLL